jgi:hypothetical protein
MSSKEDDKILLRAKVLSHVKYAEKALALLETLSVTYIQIPFDVKDAFIKIKSFFIEKELNAYRDLLLIIDVIGDNENQEATRMAFKRFLSADMSIMHFWNHNGEAPGSWLDKDEERIRGLFKEVERELNRKHKPTSKKKSKPKLN